MSPLEYIRKQQVENVKKEDSGITAATIGESVEVDRKKLRQGTSTLLNNGWMIDGERRYVRCGNLHKMKVLVVDEVSHSCNLLSLIPHDNVDVRAEVFRARLEWNWSICKDVENCETLAAVTSGLLTIVKTGITTVSYFGNVTASLFALTIVRKFTPRWPKTIQSNYSYTQAGFMG